MKILKLHSWHPTPAKAIEIQRKLKKRIRLQFASKKIRIIAGADASFKDEKALKVKKRVTPIFVINIDQPGEEVSQSIICIIKV